MPRTAEQRDADDALSAAIEAVQNAYHGEPEGVLTSYLVIAKRKWWNDDGDGVTSYYTIPKDNDMPLDEQFGLMGYALTLCRKDIADAAYGD
ncbi:hypothetical protein [Nocardia abscessus]|uniref:hypothetical protein n=1 Tax=Nocardia abscessus TaxID=120957 RepID=UPI0024576E6B|nr:hypothetical protein [Nocardia abscessus]